jgi:DNA (cytosine-5)-methyltransferase 1
LKVIDFFCGCGGASEGFRQAGFNIALGLDFDEKASQTYKLNFPEAAFIKKDIRKVSAREVAELVETNRNRDEPLLIAACAPCQPFSGQNKTRSDSDVRRTLLDQTHRFIRKLRPEYIVLENVPGMQKIDSAKEGPFGRFLRLLTRLNYQYVTFIAKAEEYGVPQKRKRLVLLASSNGPITIPARTHGEGLQPFTTVRDFIEDYPTLEAGSICGADPVHSTAGMNCLNLERIRNTPEGGDRRNWPVHLINECHKNYSGHTDTYGRMFWNKPAPTLTTKCNSYSNGRFGHPDVTQDRAISIREASRLQTFPADYQFAGSIGFMARQVGNAVPCELARKFGLSIIKHHQNVQDGQN